MDRRVDRPATPGWRNPRVLVAVALILAAALVWRFLPASGSTDLAAADVETGIVERAPFADYLPVRATVAPRVTTLVGVRSKGCSYRTVRWSSKASRSRCSPTRR